MIVVIHAHPYPGHSRVCGALLDAIRPLPDLEIRSLYQRYPDFDIDVEAEQQALARADCVVWLHPCYWYSAPALLKHYFDKVLERGLVHDADPCKLHGKGCLWVTTVGDDESSFASDGANRVPFARFGEPIEQTARFGGMVWEPPFVVFGAQTIPAEALADRAQALRARLEQLTAEHARRAPVGVAP